MSPLTDTDAETLRDLLTRAVANRQFSVCVASPFPPGLPDLLNEGDMHDGNGVQDAGIFAQVMTGSGEEPSEDADCVVRWTPYKDRPEVHLFIPDDSVQHLASSQPLA